MREKQHGGRQNTPVLVTFRITRASCTRCAVPAQPGSQHISFPREYHFSVNTIALHCTRGGPHHCTEQPNTIQIQARTCRFMWSNFCKDIVSIVSHPNILSTSCHKSNKEIFIVKQKCSGWPGWSIITNIKLRRHQTSHYFHFCEVEGTPLLTAHQTLSTKHKNACVGSVECQRHRVRLDSVWPRVTCPCHVMDTCHVSAPALDTCAGTRCDVIQIPLRPVSPLIQNIC